MERFLKIVSEGGRKSVYSSKLTHLKITHYRSLLNKKIKGIVHTFSNIIHLDFEESMDCTGKVLKLIVESYPNLEYLNLQKEKYISCNDGITDKGLNTIAQSCHKLEYLNISHRTDICKLLICNVIRSYPRF